MMTPLRALLLVGMVAPLAAGCVSSPPDPPAAERLPDCRAADVELWLGDPIAFRVGDELGELPRTVGASGSAGDVTLIYRGGYVSVVRPAAAIEYVRLVDCSGSAELAAAPAF